MICEPDLYKNYTYIPEFATTQEQIEFLEKSGKNKYCYGGKTIDEISGDCEGIEYLPGPYPDTVPKNTQTCNKNVGDCYKNNCEIYKGGIINSCKLNNNQEVPNSENSRVKCNSQDCICNNPDDCNQNGLCLSQNPNKIINYGIAKGLPEWQCPYYYCRVYDRNLEKWVSLNTKAGEQACSAICLPELYKKHKTIPNGITAEKQINYLISDNLGGNINKHLIQENYFENVCKPSETSENTGCIIS